MKNKDKDISDLNNVLKELIKNVSYDVIEKVVTVSETLAKENVHGNYLGVRTGLLYSSISSGMEVKKKNIFRKEKIFGYVTTGTTYGAAYETGNHRKYKSNSKIWHKVVIPAKKEWIGKKHRPFLSDAIKNSINYIKD